jgi:hypothetical protein
MCAGWDNGTPVRMIVVGRKMYYFTQKKQQAAEKQCYTSEAIINSAMPAQSSTSTK